MDLWVWLRSLGLGKYEAAFRENEIDETVLLSLTHETLKELGVTAVGHRLKLLDECYRCSTGPWRTTSRLPLTLATTASTPSASPARNPGVSRAWQHSEYDALYGPCEFFRGV